MQKATRKKLFGKPATVRGFSLCFSISILTDYNSVMQYVTSRGTTFVFP